jgi:hydroxymethylpyrimidine pyrophosphatase-like HAD family hydrolase
MTQLFLCDIDGCIAMPYEAWDLPHMAELAALLDNAKGGAPHHPAFGLCTGRSYAYAEAVAQALGVVGPVLFESGAGWFDLDSAQTRWHPAFTDEVADGLAEVRRYMEREIVAKEDRISIDYGKRAQAGLVGPSAEIVGPFLPGTRTFVADRFPDFHVFETHVSIDVVPKALTKAEAMRWAAEDSGLALSDLAFMGDTRGDVPAMEAVGLAFAPENAQDVAKAAADVVTDGPVLEGVLEAYRWCVARNAGAAEQAG